MTYSYGKKLPAAITGVTAVIPEGIHLLAGENGAGKTTMLHLLAGVSRPQAGSVRVNGSDPASNRPSEMGKTFLLEENTHFPGRTIREFAQVHSTFYPGFSDRQFAENLVAFGMSGDEPMKRLSLGNRKKAQLAYVLALGVEVLLLDEPTNALDIESKQALRKMMAANLRDDQTVIVATHTVSELDKLYDGAMILTRSVLQLAATEEAVARRLAFTVTGTPDPDALYSESQIGRALNILEATDDEDTRVDWRLLYSALHSPNRERVLQAIFKN